jgi:hypothetical protein
VPDLAPYLAGPPLTGAGLPVTAPTPGRPAPPTDLEIHVTLNDLGAEQAERIRAAAAELAAIEGLDRSSNAREVLLDIGRALDDLTGPVQVLIEEHLSYLRNDRDPDFIEYADELRGALEALATAARGIEHAADNH